MLPRKTLPYVVLGQNFVESFSNVTIMFADIVSYTTISANLSAFQVGIWKPDLCACLYLAQLFDAVRIRCFPCPEIGCVEFFIFALKFSVLLSLIHKLMRLFTDESNEVKERVAR